MKKRLDKKRPDFTSSPVHTKEIFRALKLVFEDGLYMDKAIEKTMQANKRWGVLDRTYVAETIREIIRNWRLIITVSGIEEKLTENNLRVILATWLLMKGKRTPDDAKAFKGINVDKTFGKLEKYKKIRRIRESIPDWLDKLGEKEFGKRWDKLLQALNRPPELVLRANLLKTNPVELQKKLNEEFIETLPINWAREALLLKFNRNVFRTEAFKNGLFEVQDAASQMVAEWLDLRPGLRVVDACAGTGGKSLQIAALMKNKGKIIALDNKDYKLQELRKRASRAGAGIIETKHIDTTKVIKRLKDTADRLLLDVPCSGLGVLRRNPDSKWKLKEEEIARVIKLQRELLDQFSGITKAGGKMVYATCSILASEGEEQTKYFLNKNPDKWKLVGEKRYWPDVDGYDGFYIAVLERIV